MLGVLWSSVRCEVQEKFTLYWSNLELYEKCPQAFLWRRGWTGIDVGGGPGRPKPNPVRTSRHHAVMGLVIGNVIERLYNDELWREPEGLTSRLVAMVDKEWDRVASKPKNWVDYRVAGTRAELVKVCKDGVRGYMSTMRAHRLLGEYARAEVEMLGWVRPTGASRAASIPVGGRADLVIRRKDTGIRILDGKNALTKSKYTDPDQVRWYALLFYLAYRELPTSLGFVYFRYPHGAPVLDSNGQPTGEIEQGVDWIPFTRDDLRGLAQRAVEARRAMEKQQFDAKPVPSNCKFCDFESVCPARQEQKAANRRKNPNSIEGVAGAEGFIDLTLGSSGSG